MSYNNRFKSIFMRAGLLAVFMSGLGVSGVANADDRYDRRHSRDHDDACPVGVLPNSPGDPSTTLDMEFGKGTSDLTTCLKEREKIKVVMQLNQVCRDSYIPTDGSTKVVNNLATCSRPYALGNLRNMLNDLWITNGIAPEDIDIRVVVHSGGGDLLIKGNKFESAVTALIADGVRFFFCQNTTRGFIKAGKLPAGDATSHLIAGVEYVTAGVTAISDLQEQGYRYVQP